MEGKATSRVILILLFISISNVAFQIKVGMAESVGCYISVPYHRQIKYYYCGPASLEMLFDFYGLDIPQLEIADVARTSAAGTYTPDMVRAAHFSNLSTSVGREMPGNVTGYTARELGYAAFEHSGFTFDELKSLIAAGYPIVVCTTWHYRVVAGYNSTHVTFQDSYYGEMLNMTWEAFDRDWDYSNHWGLFVSPWNIDVSIPQNVSPGSVFNITATITYPDPPPFPSDQYPALMANTTITLPEGLSLVSSETAKKTIGTGELAAGASANVKWTVRADSLGFYTISVEAEGKVAGFAPSLPSYPPYPEYSYEDRIGGFAESNITVFPPGVSGDLVGRGAWPEHHHFVLSKDGDSSIDDRHGTPGYLTLYGMVKNFGNVTIPAGVYKVVWNFSDSKGSIRIVETVGAFDLAPGETTVLTYNASSRDFALGRYYVKVRCNYYYAMEGVKTKTFAFSVVF